MEYRTYSGKTVEEALTGALIEMSVTSDQIEYEVIEKGSSGFLGVGSKNAVIRVRKKEIAEEPAESFADLLKASPAEGTAVYDAADEADKSDKIVEEAVPNASETQEDAAVSLTEVAEQFLSEVLPKMGAKVKLKISMDEKDRVMEIDMEGRGTGILIGKRGQTLDALQYLTSLVVNRHSDSYIRLKMDTENYRERRKETLENLARNIASKVKRTGREVSLEPMNPYERRIIHSALQNDPYVTTFSEGEGNYRHVIVAPKD